MIKQAKHLHPGPTGNTGANRPWIGTEPKRPRQNGPTTNVHGVGAVDQGTRDELPEEDSK